GAQDCFEQRLSIGIAIEPSDGSRQVLHAGIFEDTENVGIVCRKQIFAFEPIAQAGGEIFHLVTADLAGRPQLLIGGAEIPELRDLLRALLGQPLKETALHLLGNAREPGDAIGILARNLVDLVKEVTPAFQQRRRERAVKKFLDHGLWSGAPCFDALNVAVEMAGRASDPVSEPDALRADSRHLAGHELRRSTASTLAKAGGQGISIAVCQRIHAVMRDLERDPVPDRKTFDLILQGFTQDIDDDLLRAIEAN